MNLIETYGKDLIGKYVYYLHDRVEVLCRVTGVTIRRNANSYAEIETIVSAFGNFTMFDTNGLLNQRSVVVSERCVKFILTFARRIQL